MTRSIALLLFILSILGHVCAQPIVGLDHYYNHEINPQTGKTFHYTWDDEEMSGFSQLGKLFEEQGFVLEMIQSRPDKNSLMQVDIFIIVDPDTPKENPSPNYLRKSEIGFLTKWVRKGGILLLMANDGPNCEFTHFNRLARSFGFEFIPMTLNPVVGQQWNMAAETNLPEHPLFSGVKKIYLKEVAPVRISKGVRPVLFDQDSGSVIIAETKYGKGYVLAVGDPWLYNEYIDHWLLPNSFENKKCAENLVRLLHSKLIK